METKVHARLSRPAASASTRGAPPGAFLIPLGGVSLLAGLDAALVLLGLPAPVAEGRLADTHGPLMVFGFLGTLIAVERAQALRQAWGWLSPACLSAGALLLAAGIGSPWLGWLLMLDGAALLAAVYGALWLRVPLPLVAVQALSAVLLTAAAGLAPALGMPQILGLLTAFLVLTIASERAELSPIGIRPSALAWWLGLASWLALNSIGSLVWPTVADRLFGLGLLATAAWLFHLDAARRVVFRTQGSQRFAAAALLAGYLWLGVAGAVWAVGAARTPGGYDLAVHGVFLGFGISMVMAHASIILPAVVGRPLPYRAAMWLPLGLLHIGVAIRFVGDLADVVPTWQLGSVISVIGLLLFVLTAAYSAMHG